MLVFSVFFAPFPYKFFNQFFHQFFFTDFFTIFSLIFYIEFRKFSWYFPPIFQWFFYHLSPIFLPFSTNYSSIFLFNFPTSFQRFKSSGIGILVILNQFVFVFACYKRHFEKKERIFDIHHNHMPGSWLRVEEIYICICIRY